MLLDDFDEGGAALSHLLKIWADEYGNKSEAKFGNVPLTYKHFVITSNFLPDELWPSGVTLEAIRRRFMFV